MLNVNRPRKEKVLKDNKKAVKDNKKGINSPQNNVVYVLWFVTYMIKSYLTLKFTF